jgi:CheY-like chemotaxis protein
VLLVEDNEVNLKFAQRLLERNGHTVFTATNGRQAVTALQESALGRFDLVLMDVQMPEMDGLEATGAVREWEKVIGSRVPILAMTAIAMQGDRERCLQAGMDGYVAKPIQVEELFSEIDRLVPFTHENTSESTGPLKIKEGLDAVAAGSPADEEAKFMAELAELFFQSCPESLAHIHEAVTQQDGNALERSAHKLKGSVSHFTTRGAFEIAQLLVEKGRQNNFSGAEEAIRDLEDEIENLRHKLQAHSG